MERYSIYSYQLKEKPFRNGVLAMPDSQDVSNLSIEQRFEILFGEKRGSDFTLKKFKKNDADSYPCLVLSHDANIILLRLVNEMDKDFWEEESADVPVPKIEKKKRKTKPFCYIIIDNRPGMQLIAIQSDSAAWRNTVDVKTLLQETINWQSEVLDYGFEVKILSKMLPSKFWEYVDYRRKKENVYIKSITFSFANYRRRPDMDIKQALSSNWRRFDSLIEMINQVGGDKGELKITPSKDDALVKRKFADIKHMVEICAISQYSLSITFSDDVTYKCNQELRAELPMKEERIREDFEYQQGDLFRHYEIMDWLDDIKQKTDKYNDVEEFREKPGGKVKKQVS